MIFRENLSLAKMVFQLQAENELQKAKLLSFEIRQKNTKGGLTAEAFSEVVLEKVKEKTEKLKESFNSWF